MFRYALEHPEEVVPLCAKYLRTQFNVTDQYRAVAQCYRGVRSHSNAVRLRQRWNASVTKYMTRHPHVKVAPVDATRMQEPDRGGCAFNMVDTDGKADAMHFTKLLYAELTLVFDGIYGALGRTPRTPNLWPKALRRPLEWLRRPHRRRTRTTTRSSAATSDTSIPEAE